MMHRPLTLLWLLAALLAVARPANALGTTVLPKDRNTSNVVSLGRTLEGDTVYVCIRAVPPYVLPRDYNTIGPNGGPATLDFLRNVTLDGANLDGFDTRYLNYIFSVVGITPVYLPTESEAGLYRALLNRSCDMAVSSISLDPKRNSCNATCPWFPGTGEAAPPPPGGNATNATSTSTSSSDSTSSSGDTTETGFACCVEYSNPYVHSSYALLSIAQPTGVDIIRTLTSPEVVNALTTVLLILFISSWLSWIIESRSNYGLRSIERNVYWATVTLTTVGYGDVHPSSALGRAVSAIWMMIAVIGFSSFTSIVSSQMTAARILIGAIDALTDIDGTLCVEYQRDELKLYIQTEGTPLVIVYKPLSMCIDGLVSGAYQAVLSDRPVLNWIVNMYNIPNGYVSPPLADNPQAFAFRSNDDLRHVLNPQIIRMRVDPEAAAFMEQLTVKFFPEPDATLAPLYPTLNWKVIIALCVIAGVSAIIAIVHGVIRYRRRMHVAKARAEVTGGRMFNEEDARANLLDVAEHLAMLHSRIERLHARMQPGNAIPPANPPPLPPRRSSVRMSTSFPSPTRPPSPSQTSLSPTSTPGVSPFHNGGLKTSDFTRHEGLNSVVTEGGSAAPAATGGDDRSRATGGAPEADNAEEGVDVDRVVLSRRDSG